MVVTLVYFIQSNLCRPGPGLGPGRLGMGIGDTSSKCIWAQTRESCGRAGWSTRLDTLDCGAHVIHFIFLFAAYRLMDLKRDNRAVW